MIKNKIKTRKELQDLRKKWKKEAKIIGFTSGSFDIIHAGHTSYLEKAKEACDILIVAINSDASVKKYKGEDRPIVPEKERLTQIAALESVDFVFLFDERRNNLNIETLQPDLYIKAGDYDLSKLSSKPIVESYGGKVLLVPLEFKSSSSDMIAKIIKLYSNNSSSEIIEKDKAVHFDKKPTKKHRAILLDRDGVINQEVEYLHEPEKFKLLPNALEGLKKMQDMEFKLAVITTQAGIGLGYFTKEDFYKINKTMFKALAPKKIILDKIYFCPHSKGDNCICRKPKTGLLEQAEKDLNLELNKSYMIGDKTSDIKAGIDAGCKTILIKGPNNDSEFKVQPDYIANDLLDAANYILEQERKL